MKLLAIFSVALLILAGCSSGEGGDGGQETGSSQAKAQVDKSMSKEEQANLDAKVKAWDPKQDKK